jgi:Tfp pilus assembly pilus retraction ATPase PilT
MYLDNRIAGTDFIAGGSVLRKFSEILSVPQLTDIHIVLPSPSDGGNFVTSRFRVFGEISREERIEIDLPGILPEVCGRDMETRPQPRGKQGLGVFVGDKRYRLRLTPSESLGRPMLFVRVLPSQPPPIAAVGGEYFFGAATERDLLGSGLVLVAGQAGSGKSTYIASVLQQIVVRYPIHIVSLEDPVEYIIASEKGYATQKEVYFDSPSFNAALRGCMREDPDVLFIGEIRDYETAETALTAAESGHLVFGTIHAGSNAGIVDRLLGLFGAKNPAFAAHRIAQCLRLCLFVKRYGAQTRYVYAEIADSLRTVIRNQMLHQWMIYSSETIKEVRWGRQ